jgi:hypothetical protein
MAAVLAHREVESLLSSDQFLGRRHAGGGVSLAQELPRQERLNGRCGLGPNSRHQVCSITGALLLGSKVEVTLDNLEPSSRAAVIGFAAWAT